MPDTVGDLSDQVSNDPRFIAGVDMVARTGATMFHIGYDDRDKEVPTFWTAISSHDRSKGPVFTLGSGFDPLQAVMKLCSKLVDGGHCKHCGKPTIFDEDFSADRFAEDDLCWYVYDETTETFRRSCEGKTNGN